MDGQSDLLKGTERQDVPASDHPEHLRAEGWPSSDHQHLGASEKHCCFLCLSPKAVLHSDSHDQPFPDSR